MQHAYNPVDWYPWSEEAFEKAKAEDKPVLISIGYSTCHWCHVMERESFEDEKVAAYMNAHFINIKIDREERPDLDKIYMEACQIMTGSGGWPLNCFLLPDGRPFYAGTYYPPQPMHNRSSWTQLLSGIKNAFDNKRSTAEEQANRLTTNIEKADGAFVNRLSEKEEEATDARAFTNQVYQQLSNNFDETYGGFGGAPKFPAVMPLHYLLLYAHTQKEPAARDKAFFSIDRMVKGGIYDQIGGGFARYATDRAWLIPHFEKMLYDNALLVSLLSEAYTINKKPLWKAAIEQSLAFIEREMTSEEGGFYAALDADSEGEEGKFYVWQKEEVEKVLGADAQLVCQYYDVTDSGNWEGQTILWRPHVDEEFAEQHGLELKDLEEILNRARQQLLDARSLRPRPGLDDKILLGWNALQCSAYARAYRALRKEAYRSTAIRNMEFLLSRFSTGAEIGLYRVYKEGHAKYDALLDDYAYLIDALLEVYEITFDLKWLKQAAAYVDFVLQRFGTASHPLLYYTAAGQADLIVRRREVFDGAQPSGNSMMAGNLERLGILMGRADWRSKAGEMLRSMKEAIGRYPSSFGNWAIQLHALERGGYEIAVVGPKFEELAKEIQEEYRLPGVLMAASRPNDEFPLLKDKQLSKDTYIYVCKDYSCQYPVETVEEMLRLLTPL